MKCPRCQQENPPQAKFCLECATPLKAVSPGGRPAPSYSDVTNALSEAHEQQTATAEILRVISRSATTYEPVFEAIVRSASTLCRAPDVIILMLEEGGLRAVASIGPVAAAVRQSQLLDGVALPLTREYVSGRAFIDRRTVHVADVSAMPDEFPVGTALQRQYGGRGTTLSVPLLRDDTALGVITLVRDEVSPFSEQQITLLETFARQAVIAIENVRLFNETKEALDRQTATSEILRVISSSPTDLQPVLDAVAEKAADLCGASDGSIFRVDGDCLRLVVHHASLPADPVGQFTVPMIRGTVAGRTVLERRLIHVTDLQQQAEEFPEGSAFARRFGHRTILSVPLLREGVGIGCIQIRRSEVQPFAQKQVELLQAFADQAVIAIENVRLFTELQEKNRALTQAHAQVSEALERQTATSEILGVISSSPTDVKPVFDSLVASAARLCGANDVLLLIREGDVLRPAAGVGLFWESLAGDFRVPLVRGSVAARSVIDGATLHIPDLAVVSEADFSLGRDLQRRFGHRTVLAVPLFREGVALGTIFAMRFEVRPFADQQIALLKTFADQAVIAIENVRLFTELQEKNKALTEAHSQVTEALEQQAATADILRVISSSQTDVQPVFDTIVRSVTRLCDAAFSFVFLTEGGMLYHPARHGSSAEIVAAVRALFPRPLDRETAAGTAILTKAVVHVPDVLEQSAIPVARETGRAVGYRSLLTVPMLRQGEALGAITVNRRQPGRFSDAEGQLLKTFADQAVIAIENVRLFTELQERTAELTHSVSELTALGEVGRALSSTLDLEAVLQTIVTRATQLTRSAGCVVWEYDKPREEFRPRVSHYADDTDIAILPARGV